MFQWQIRSCMFQSSTALDTPTSPTSPLCQRTAQSHPKDLRASPCVGRSQSWGQRQCGLRPLLPLVNVSFITRVLCSRISIPGKDVRDHYFTSEGSKVSVTGPDPQLDFWACLLRLSPYTMSHLRWELLSAWCGYYANTHSHGFPSSKVEARRRSRILY